MRCTNCGAEVDGISSFCPNCKQLINKGNIDSSQNIQNTQDISQYSYQTEANSNKQAFNDMLGQIYIHRTMKKRMQAMRYNVPDGNRNIRPRKARVIIPFVFFVVFSIALYIIIHMII